MAKQHKANVLVVDDEEVSRSLLNDFLGDIGYRVQTAENGEVALNIVKTNHLDLIITDMRMPGMSGLELIRSVHQINDEVCFIVITGYSSIETAIAAIREGAYDYISKPYNLDEMKIIIERAIERQNLLRDSKEKEYYRELSILDGLTQVYNHRYFHELITREINRGARYPQSFGLMMLDLDNFKGFNDSYGHLAGDCALREVAQAITSSLRKVDLVCRYGGEEFVAIMPHTNRDGAKIACERVRNAVEIALIKDEKGDEIGKITASIGLASFPENGQTKENIIKSADIALYEAKNQGKNRVCIFQTK
ncbi:MAG: diguanylate cyclase [Candidatus Gygaella obscura]|nr:diguanylate cyclase [Candidatus Gygaella obscura]